MSEATETTKVNGAAGKPAVTKVAKVSKLKAKDPKLAEPSKPKWIIYGPPGAGKTWTSLDFPVAYYIDTEGGASRAHYTDKIKAAGGVYLGPEDGSLDPVTIIEQIQALATEEHEYKTLIIDSITKIYNSIIAHEAERLGEKDAFGASKKPAIAFCRRLTNWLNRLDMNVILIAHEKIVWGEGAIGKIGETFDAWDKFEYELDLVLQISKRGASRYATPKKSRLLGFPEGEKFEWSYPEFAKRYGKDVMEKSATPVRLATREQVEEVKKLLDVVRIPESKITKLFTDANVDDWTEMSTESIAKAIAFFRERIV